MGITPCLRLSTEYAAIVRNAVSWCSYGMAALCVAVFRVRGTLLNTVVKSQVWRFQAKEPLTSNPPNFETPIDS